jgi:peptidoglycan L-alanyl-D-glutamate endopeptidase CwlK
MDSISEALLSQVHPELARRVRRMASVLSADSILSRVVQGLRTMAQQQALWQKGRDANGIIIDPKSIVTRARPGFSYHNYGLAVDIVPSMDVKRFIPDWNVRHPIWQHIVNAAHASGLTTGATWRDFPDWPHVQLTGPYPEAAPTTELRTMAASSLQPVWDVITKFYEVNHGNQGNQAG